LPLAREHERRRLSSLAVVPVLGMSRLTDEAVSTALSIGDEVGFVLERAIQRGTADVVIYRLRFRLSTMTRPDVG
jgi:hypothetical protein